MSFALSVAGATLLEAFRNRLLWLALAVAVIALGLARFLNQVAIAESVQIQLALVASLLRFAAVFVLSTFIITSMVREADDKVTEFLLAQPVPRAAYFFGKFAGYAASAIAIAAVFGLSLAPFAPPAGLLLWSVSLCFELLIVTSVSLFCVLSLTQVLSAFAATAGFYLLARSVSTMQLIAAAGISDQRGFVDAAVAWIVDGIALLLPSLDRMAQTAWLTDPGAAPSGFGLLAAQTAIYVVLIASAALFDLYRRNF